jgi:hypothetical protein
VEFESAAPLVDYQADLRYNFLEDAAAQFLHRVFEQQPGLRKALAKRITMWPSPLQIGSGFSLLKVSE